MEIQDWLVWFLVAFVLLIAEIFTPGFLLATFGIAAIFSGFTALLGGGIVFQVIVFILASVIAFFALRPIIMKHFYNKTEGVPTNADALSGVKGRVTKEINPDSNNGRAKIKGEDWWAVTEDEKETIEVGASVEVIKVSGTKVIVKRTENGG